MSNARKYLGPIDENEAITTKMYVDQASTLPTASSSVLGGIKVGSGLNIASSVLSVDQKITSLNINSTTTLTAAQVSGTLISNYGQSDATTLTLPTAVAGYNFMVVFATSSTDAFKLKANTNDKIYLDGVAGTDNGEIEFVSPTVGTAVSFATFLSGTGVYDWMAVTINKPEDLPTASSSVLGGVKVGDNLTITEGVLSADDQHGVPSGGTTGQVLAKLSSTDYATEWVDAAGGGGVSLGLVIALS